MTAPSANPEQGLCIPGISSGRFSSDDLSKILGAISYAAVAHAEVGQLRDYSGEPYIVHPIEVVNILLLSDETDTATLMAGALHDVVEDTHKTLIMVRGRFGEEVAEIVSEVTNPDKPEGLSRAERKALDREHVAAASARAQNCKCADVASNIGTGKHNLAEIDPEFATVYLPEKKAAMGVLTKADPKLWNIAMDRIQEGLDMLEAKGFKVKRQAVRI